MPHPPRKTASERLVSLWRKKKKRRTFKWTMAVMKNTAKQARMTVLCL